MPTPLSTHLPLVSGAIQSVTGTLDVDTGIRDVQVAACNLLGALVANEESFVTYEKLALVAGATQVLRLRVYKGGSNHGTIGDSAVSVSWLALGR